MAIFKYNGTTTIATRFHQSLFIHCSVLCCGFVVFDWTFFKEWKGFLLLHPALQCISFISMWNVTKAQISCPLFQLELINNLIDCQKKNLLFRFSAILYLCAPACFLGSVSVFDAGRNMSRKFALPENFNLFSPPESQLYVSLSVAC